MSNQKTGIEELEELPTQQEREVGSSSVIQPTPRRLIGFPLTLERQMVQDDDKTIEIRTGLTSQEFIHVFNLIQEEGEHIRRGKKLLDLDIRLVIFLQWIKFGQSYQTLADSFKLHKSRVQSIITDLWTPLANALFNDLIPMKPRDYTPVRNFETYPHALGALDATLIEIRKPLHSIESREYLSGKHRRYGVRLQVLAAPDGYCIHHGGIINGRRHDFMLYQESRLANETLVTVVQEDGTRVPTRPAILADGGYAGIQMTYPEAIIPRRRQRGRQLSDEDRIFNRNLSHDRCIVERFFGRLKGYWGILQKPIRIDRNSLDALLKICVSLTNLKIRNSPMHVDEPIYNPQPEYTEEEVDEVVEEGQEHNSGQPQPETPGLREGTQVRIGSRRQSQGRTNRSKRSNSRNE